MEVRYQREVNHNYMILDAPGPGGGYECRMLAANSIRGLLKFRVRQYEDKREFYYEITSKQPLKRLLEQRKISGEELRSLLLGISSVTVKIEEFLLREEQLLLDPDFIYIDPDSFTVYLCLLPGSSCNFPEALSGLLQYLLEKINHQDREGVVMAYNLYQESLRENYGMADLLRHLTGSGDDVFGNRREGGAVKRGGPGQTDGNVESHMPEYGFEEHMIEGDEAPYIPRPHQRGPRPEYIENETYYAVKKKAREPEREIKRENSIQSGEKTKDSRGGIRIKDCLQILVCLAGVEMGVWYFTGTEGLGKYGIWIAAGAAIAGLAKLLWPRVRRAPGTGDSKIENKNSDRGISGIKTEKAAVKVWDVGQETAAGEEFLLHPESEEEYRQRLMEERKREEQHSREEGTALLSENAGQSEGPVLVSIGENGNNIEIPYLPFVIGKHAELADFCLPRPTVSRLHLRIDKREGVYIVTDLNSTNGTVVEGYKLQANETVSIRDGDIISIAEVKYRFAEMQQGQKSVTDNLKKM